MKRIAKFITCAVALSLFLSVFLSSCAPTADDRQDTWQSQWDKLVIDREKDIVCIKYEYVFDISKDKKEDRTSYDGRIYSKEDIENILSAISVAGAEFEKLTEESSRWYDITTPGGIRFKIISDMQPNYLYTKNGEAPSFFNTPTERTFADESNSGYAYAIKVYVKGNGVYIQSEDGYYVSKGKPDYAALSYLLPD